MIKKALKVLFVFCLFAFQSIQAQTTVKGVVTDAKSGMPIPGVNIFVKGTTSGVSSDLDGQYSINVPSRSTILVFSFLGSTTKEVAVGDKTTLNVSLSEDSQQLGEVVVTSLGIKRQQKSLGYSTSTIKSGDIVKTAPTNFASALYGKATGVQIASTAGGATSAVNITIRGVNSITGKSQPLIIMDGVPIRDGEVKNNDYWNDQRLRGNGLIDINPEDIESISILKGASAAALYGSEAVNGVVLVTTKKGKGSGMSVDVSMTTSIDEVAYLPRYQNVRGAGAPLNVSDGGQDENGFIHYDTNGDGVDDMRGLLQYSINFGPKFDGQPIMSWDGVVRPYSAQKDNYKNLFQTAHNTSEHISIANVTEKSNTRFAFTHQDNEGQSLGSDSKKNVINLNTSFSTAKNITTDVTINYINQTVNNRPYSIDRMINNFSGMMGRFDNGDWYLNNYKTSLGYRYVTGTGQSLTPDENIVYNGMRGDIMDYVWRVKENNYKESSDRVIGVVTSTWDVAKGLKLRGRVSTDFTARTAEFRNTTEKPLAFGNSGGFGVEKYNANILYGDLLLTYTRPITEDLNFTVMGGYNGSKETSSQSNISTNNGLSAENWFDINASVDKANASNSNWAVTKDAFLGTVNFDYKNYLFLEGTIRRDRTSTMNPNQNSFTYPSVNSSFVFSDAFELPAFINYGKFRSSWGIVGNYPEIYAANIAYTQQSLGSQGASQPVYTTLPTDSFGNDGIKPEKKHEYEFGIETKMFNSRLGFDISYYNAKVVDQILPLTLPISTGASSILTNVGTLRNTGIEIGINATPIKTTDFEWNTTLNISRNRNKIEKLANGLSEIIHQDYDGNAAVLKSVVGGAMGDLYAHPVATDANGNKIVDPNGMYKVDADKMEKFGNVMPKFIGGFLNTFTYKNVSLNVNVDYRYGGVVMPTGINWMTSRGLTEESLNNMDTEHGGLTYYNNGDHNVQLATGATAGPGGEKVYHDGMLLPGVQVDGAPNDHVVSQADYYWTVYNWGGPQYSPNTRYELYIKENSYVKLRELSLDYSFPKSILKKIGFTKFNLSVFGRNLFYVYRTIKDMDAEQTTAGSRWFQNVNNTGTNPSSRTYGLMLRASL
ncbi:MAG: SusC/RagA family TonB-linked outer membrane protein [Flavobacterium sp.]|uniref:SusC/RagA family TonB-linked outer membrane protein n=1 Tax=Flavobacterium sp. TaxID=239 RepID=UPI00263956F3|nr:SusC/RagA family TonB-linked outer membrane protein [Flavobacterium sp.]MDD5149208.1 SusC/RagA family TonB-linked outer membrane protein [Flavobacterium sp.]